MANTRVTTPVTDFDKATSLPGLKIPSGDNSNQPTGAAAEQGMIRNDTDETVDSSTSALAHYNGTAWRYFAATESADPVLVDYVIVGGGGGGGGYNGGGGAGGVRSTLTETGGSIGTLETILSLSVATPYAFSIGAGGVGGLHQSSASTNGSLTSFNGIESLGGGAAATYANINQAGNGGSGGAGNSYVSGTQTGGTGQSNQGYAGNTALVKTNPGYTSGGGGGAGGLGGTQTNAVSSNGGTGVDIIWNPSNLAIGGGGGGGAYSPGGTAGTASHGGANGFYGITGANATALTGGGGGGAGYGNGGAHTLASNGGSGAIYLKYLKTYIIGLSSGSSVTTEDSTHKYTTITGGTGNVEFTQ